MLLPVCEASQQQTKGPHKCKAELSEALALHFNTGGCLLQRRLVTAVTIQVLPSYAGSKATAASESASTAANSGTAQVCEADCRNVRLWFHIQKDAAAAISSRTRQKQRGVPFSDLHAAEHPFGCPHTAGLLLFDRARICLDKCPLPVAIVLCLSGKEATFISSRAPEHMLRIRALQVCSLCE